MVGDNRRVKGCATMSGQSHRHLLQVVRRTAGRVTTTCTIETKEGEDAGSFVIEVQEPGDPGLRQLRLRAST